METKTSNSGSGSDQQSEEEFGSEKLSEEELKYLLQKIEREWPVRCKLAELAGFKANPKNIMALYKTPFDLTIHELYLEVLFRQPQNADEALKVIRSIHEVADAQWAAHAAALKAAKDAKRKKK